MVRILLIIIIVHIAHVAFAALDSTIINGNVEIEYYHHDTRSRCEYPLKDGIRHGKGICYFSHRTKTQAFEGIIPYENGKIHGTVNHYYPNGNIMISMEYKHGKKISEIVYDSSGKIGTSRRVSGIEWSTSVIKDNIETVTYIYHPNNVDYCKYPLKNGYLLRHGIGKCFFKNGNIAESIPYENDRKHGISQTYYENGALMFETPFKNNHLDGYIKVYNKNGKFKKELKRYEEYRDYKLYSEFQ